MYTQYKTHNFIYTIDHLKFSVNIPINNIIENKPVISGEGQVYNSFFGANTSKMLTFIIWSLIPLSNKSLACF